ncbi:MAG TPA: SGNH/GDSL hydrolase family protein [Thermoanaerobaculia bacterium]
MNFLALGDSYTIGEGVAASERWPEQLAGALRSRGVDVDPPQIIAQTGWTTGELSAAIDEAAPRGPFDLVTLLIGVNDQYRGLSTGEYRTRFVRLLRRAIGLAGDDASRVIVISIPDWSVTPFAQLRDRERIAREIDALNEANREGAVRAAARYVDVTGLSRRFPSLLAADGLHPSAEMYARWVEAMLLSF